MFIEKRTSNIKKSSVALCSAIVLLLSAVLSACVTEPGGDISVDSSPSEISESVIIGISKPSESSEISEITSETPSETGEDSSDTVSEVSEFSEENQDITSEDPGPDSKAPKFHGLTDIEIYVGGSISYRSGVKAVDDRDGEVEFTFDNSGVDIDTEGEYTVTYRASDSAGNEIVASRKVIVRAKPEIDGEMLDGMVSDLLGEIVTDDMTKPEKAKKIYYWMRRHITYLGADETTPEDAVYRAITKRSGDCYNICYLSKALLDACGIDNMVVTRYHEKATSPHYWLLVNVGTGWYHFDATPHLRGHVWECFMRTDAELADYVKTRPDKPWYYSFDESLYPARAVEKYSQTDAENK